MSTSLSSSPNNDAHHSHNGSERSGHYERHHKKGWERDSPLNGEIDWPDRHSENIFTHSNGTTSSTPYEDDTMLSEGSCETSIEGIAGLATAYSVNIYYDYIVVTDSSIEDDVEGAILPALEEFINDDLAALYLLECQLRRDRILMRDDYPVSSLAGVSTVPQDNVQGQESEYCLPSDKDDNESCNLVRGGLTAFVSTTDATDELRNGILNIIRAGMTTSSPSSDDAPNPVSAGVGRQSQPKPARYTMAHSAIRSLRFLGEHSLDVPILSPELDPVAAPRSGELTGRRDDTPAWVIAVFVLVAIVVVLVALIIARRVLEKKRGRGDRLDDESSEGLVVKNSFDAGGENKLVYDDAHTIGFTSARTSSARGSTLHSKTVTCRSSNSLDEVIEKESQEEGNVIPVVWGIDHI